MARIVLTGGNEGIGFHMTSQFLNDGHMVAVLDLKLDNLESLKQDYTDKVLLYKCDVSNPQALNKSIDDTITTFSGIDYAIHNACKCLFTGLEDTTNEEYRSVFDVNYYGAINLTRAVLPIMKKQSSGKIFFTSSGVGVMGFVNISAYASSKGALESLAKCMNIEYQGTSITFHLIHPPLTRTTSAKPLPVPEEFMADPQKVGIGIVKNIHKKRFIICHSLAQRFQTGMAYIFSYRLGSFMSKMTMQGANNNVL